MAISDRFLAARLSISNCEPKEVVKIMREDINNYREYAIRQYNGDEKRATDEFMLRKFLNEYTTSINVFNLHPRYKRKDFNRLITLIWSIAVYQKDHT